MKRLIIFFICFLFIMCSTTGKLLNLNLQMNKSEVMSVMGKPVAVRGSITNKYSQVIEVWEYLLHKTDALSDRGTYYWLYFCDGKLVQWGESGDWQREIDRIYEIRMR